MDKERKRNQKERKVRKGRLVETAAAEEIDQGRLRQYLLDDFHRCLENPAGFPTVTHKLGGGYITSDRPETTITDSVTFLDEAIRPGVLIVADHTFYGLNGD